MRVVDATVWVSLFAPQDVYHAASRRWLHQYTAGGGMLVEPAILLAEVAGAIASRTGQPALGRRAVTQLLAFPTLRLAPVDRQLGQAAADMAADLGLQGADAVYTALAAQLAIPLVTWDAEQIARVQTVIQASIPGTQFAIL
jgi:predicted nucleic acid-binding protein